MEQLYLSTPTAIKEHVCDYCGGIINKGEKYIKQINKGDTIYTWKSHECCQYLRDEMCDYDDGDGIGEETFREWIDNYLYEHHYDNEKDDIQGQYLNKSYAELSKIIYNEITSNK